jgi:hypothetical protein
MRSSKVEEKMKESWEVGVYSTHFGVELAATAEKEQLGKEKQKRHGRQGEN